MLIEIHETNIKEITNYLIKSKVIFHPHISPCGIPDFTNYLGRKFILILDRNILVLILDLVQAGTLKDSHKLKLISSLFFWSSLNRISMTSGIALMEHSHFQGDSTEAGIQHNVFQTIHKKYSLQDWFDIAVGNKSSISRIEQLLRTETNYLVDSEHHSLNYLQVLKLCQLYFQKEVNISEKLREFHKWSYENALIGMYSTFYATMFFSSRTKLANQIPNTLSENLYKNCRNVAWDLTYLSYWSTLYWNDQENDKIFLLATRDKEIKQLFSLLHSDSRNVYTKFLGEKIGEKVKKELDDINKPRPKIKFDKNELALKIVDEENRLKNLIDKTLSN